MKNPEGDTPNNDMAKILLLKAISTELKTKAE